MSGRRIAEVRLWDVSLYYALYVKAASCRYTFYINMSEKTERVIGL